MAKPDDVLKNLKNELAFRKALVLDKYGPPQPLDCKAVLAASTELSKMKQPVGRGWRLFDGFPSWSTFTPTNYKATGPWFATELDATIHMRNWRAQQFAEQLANVDLRVDGLRATQHDLTVWGNKVAVSPALASPTAGTAILPPTTELPSCSPPSEATSDKSSVAPSMTTSGDTSAPTSAKRTSPAKSAVSAGSTTREPASGPSKSYLPKNPRSKSLSPSDIKKKADKAEAASNEKAAK